MLLDPCTGFDVSPARSSLGERSVVAFVVHHHLFAADERESRRLSNGFRPRARRGWALSSAPAEAEDIAVQRRVPYESRADSIMYCQVLAEHAEARGWKVHLYDAKGVEKSAAGILGDRADEVLLGPRATLGPPWSKDHRMALAATILVASPHPRSL